MELISPILQECPKPNLPECLPEDTNSTSCFVFKDDSCAREDPVNNPCSVSCASRDKVFLKYKKTSP